MLDILSELKTEEGYSADIVRTYIPGDMSAQCPYNISRRIYVSRGRCCADIVRTLCRHCADIVRTLCEHISPGIYVRTMSALYSSLVWFLVLNNRNTIDINCVLKRLHYCSRRRGPSISINSIIKLHISISFPNLKMKQMKTISIIKNYIYQ